MKIDTSSISVGFFLMIIFASKCIICSYQDQSADPPEMTTSYIDPPIMATSDEIILPPEPPAEGSHKNGVFDVTKYGAVPNGNTESGLAFLAAWKSTCNHTGHTVFYVPEGKFLIGPISFYGPCPDNWSLKVKIMGDLVGPTSLKDFPGFDWITFRHLNGIIVLGGTNIDGRGEVEAWRQESCKKASECKQLITSLRFSNVSNGIIKNITLSNGKGFHMGFYRSNNIRVHNVNITSPWDSPNTDGIHISHSSYISITNSNIGVGNDCVSIGPGSQSISVSHLHCGPGHGISIGSLGKYENEEDAKGISVRNCTVNGTDNGVRVKTWPASQPSKAYDMRFENIVMINVSNPIIVDQEYCPSNSCNMTHPSLVKLSNIMFKNISGTYRTDSGVTLLCSSAVACENILLVDVNLKGTTPEIRRKGRFSLKGIVHGLEILSSSF